MSDKSQNVVSMHDASVVTVEDIDRETKDKQLRSTLFKDKLDFEKEDSLYFHDGVSKIDYVLATTRIKTDEELSLLSTYLLHCEKKGIHYEFDMGITVPEIIFIKFHASEQTLKVIAQIHDIDLSCDNHHYGEARRVNKFLGTVIHRPDLNPSVFRRAKDILTYKRPETITSGERSLCMYKMLKSAKYAPGKTGFEPMIKMGIFLVGYPLHEGYHEWPESGPITERQLLSKYWASGVVFYKKQPIHLIHKYYGAEMGFYFAFMGLYNNMLIYASAAGLICFIFGVIKSYFFKEGLIYIDEVCHSNKTMCVVYASQTCRAFLKLSQYCGQAKTALMFDNNATVAFSILLTFWSTITMELWKRLQSKLQYKWNLYHCEEAAKIRPEFSKNTKYRRLCADGSAEEPYIPTSIKVFHYTYTAFCIMLMVIIVMAAVMATIQYRMFIAAGIIKSNLKFLQDNIVIFVLSTSAIMNLIFIKVFEIFYSRVAIYLTEKENPRTLWEYHDSIVYKSYILAFVNNYTPFLHTAFIRGKLYDHPGEERSLLGLYADVCYPTGCIITLCIQLLFILSIRSYAGKIVRYTRPLIKTFLKKSFRSKKDPPPSFILPQWEADYKLQDLGRFYLIRDYNDVAIQYGLVILFASAFPLSPLLALINNVIELRMNAYKYVKYTKRPVHRRLPGIGAWNAVLSVATHVGTITSACLIAFNTEFVPREIYKLLHGGSIAGFAESMLSEFTLSDYPQNYSQRCAPEGITTCYYRGMRHPKSHPNKPYKLTLRHWEVIMYKLLFVIAYETLNGEENEKQDLTCKFPIDRLQSGHMHVVWLLTAVLAYIIPDIPDSVKNQLQHEEDLKHRKMIASLKKPTFPNLHRRYV